MTNFEHDQQLTSVTRDSECHLTKEIYSALTSPRSQCNVIVKLQIFEKRQNKTTAEIKTAPSRKDQNK